MPYLDGCLGGENGVSLILSWGHAAAARTGRHRGGRLRVQFLDVGILPEGFWFKVAELLREHQSRCGVGKMIDALLVAGLFREYAQEIVLVLVGIRVCCSLIFVS